MSSQSDPQKKHWLILLVLLPILLAVIAILPQLIEKGGSQPAGVSITSGNVEQSGSGNNINNVNGDVTIGQ